MMRGGRPRHVLISAFACEPGQSSELGGGWSWVSQIGARCRASVLTKEEGRSAIEAWLRDHPTPHVRFYFVDTPLWLRRARRCLIGEYLYYAVWQFLAWRNATALLARDPFELAHHVTYGSIQGVVFMHRLPVPFIFGPVGGGESAPRAFWSGGGLKAWLYEWARALRLRTIRGDPFVQSTLRTAARIVIATPDSEQLVPSRQRGKVELMGTAGMHASRVGVGPARQSPGCRIYGVGRLVHWKGYHLAIRAFARIAAKRPAATLQIIGQGPQRARLERLIRMHGLADRVSCEGWVSEAEKRRIIEEGDVFLLPSLHDAGGEALLEAMAAAKPVVCLDIGGPSVSVTPACGIKVPVRSPEQVVAGLAVALDRLISDAPLRQKMGLAARQRVLDELTWEKKGERMLALYDEVLGRSRSAGQRAPDSEAAI